MAKIKYGPLVGSMSGSIGATTFSQNRYGTYVRRRAIPTRSTTSYAMAAKARLSAVSSLWSELTEAQRIAWRVWAGNNPITDRLGDRQVLTGHAAYVGINSGLSAAAETLLDVPPLGEAPAALESASLVADIGAGGFVLTFAATPLGATERLEVNACVVSTDSVNYVSNYLRQIMFSPAAQATGMDFETELEARLGALQVGQWIHCFLAVFDNATGLRSQPIRLRVAVTST